METRNFEEFARGQFKNAGYSQLVHGISLTTGIGSEKISFQGNVVVGFFSL